MKKLTEKQTKKVLDSIPGHIKTKKLTRPQLPKHFLGDPDAQARFISESTVKGGTRKKPIKLAWLVISATGTHPGLDGGPVPRIGVYIHRIDAVNQEEARKAAAKAILRCHWAHVIYRQHVVSATVALDAGFGASGCSS